MTRPTCGLCGPIVASFAGSFAATPSPLALSGPGGDEERLGPKNLPVKAPQAGAWGNPVSPTLTSGG